MNDGRGRRRSVAAVLTEEFSGQDQEVVAIDASVARGRAYLAVRIASGEVVPVYLWLDREDRSGSDGPILWRRVMPVGESPRRWPLKVAEALTTPWNRRRAPSWTGDRANRGSVAALGL